MSSITTPTTPAAGRPVAGTEPYSWPWDGAVVPSRLALVVAGGDDAWIGRCADADAVLERLEPLAASVRAAGGVVVHLRHDPATPGRPLAAPRPVGARPDVDAADLVVEAEGIDGFYGSALDARLRRAGRDQLVLVGFGLEGPVHSTLRRANDAGYECLLLTDVAASLDPDCRDAAISTICMSGGIFGAVGTAAALLDALDL